MQIGDGTVDPAHLWIEWHCAQGCQRELPFIEGLQAILRPLPGQIGQRGSGGQQLNAGGNAICRQMAALPCSTSAP